jgi:hypothetical protein
MIEGSALGHAGVVDRAHHGTGSDPLDVRAVTKPFGVRGADYTGPASF